MRQILVIHHRVVQTQYALKGTQLEPAHVRPDILVIHTWVVGLNVSQITTVRSIKHVPITNV